MKKDDEPTRRPLAADVERLGVQLGLRPPLGVEPADLDRRRAEIAFEAGEAEEDQAKKAGKCGYLASLLIQATFPHSEPKEADGTPSTVFQRMNAHRMQLRLTDAGGKGLPYGALSRLLLTWINTEAVRTRSRHLELGHSLNDYLQKLELGRRGGPRGEITRLRNQTNRLLGCAIAVDDLRDPMRDRGSLMVVASERDLWWDPRRPDQGALWSSTITLSADFFEQITRRPVPVDLEVIKALRRSPLQLDLYAWLTWRFSILDKETTVPWEYLELQFGADYKRSRMFREKLRQALRPVLKLYPTARCIATTRGLLLSPSPPSVPKKPRRRP